MDTEYFVVYNSANWKIVEDISESLPDSQIAILTLTLSLKPINLSDLPCFVISAD